MNFHSFLLTSFLILFHSFATAKVVYVTETITVYVRNGITTTETVPIGASPTGVGAQVSPTDDASSTSCYTTVLTLVETHLKYYKEIPTTTTVVIDKTKTFTSSLITTVTQTESCNVCSVSTIVKTMESVITLSGSDTTAVQNQQSSTSYYTTVVTLVETDTEYFKTVPTTTTVVIDNTNTVTSSFVTTVTETENCDVCSVSTIVRTVQSVMTLSGSDNSDTVSPSSPSSTGPVSSITGSSSSSISSTENNTSATGTNSDPGLGSSSSDTSATTTTGSTAGTNTGSGSSTNSGQSSATNTSPSSASTGSNSSTETTSNSSSGTSSTTNATTTSSQRSSSSSSNPTVSASSATSTSSPGTTTTSLSGTGSTSSTAFPTNTGDLYSDIALSPNLNATFAREILDYHNEKRKIHQAPPMRWNKTVYEYAQAYADKYDCNSKLIHSGGQLYGENLANGFLTPLAGAPAWYSESRNFVYGRNDLQSAGHFTAMVWASTLQLGCAYKNCNQETGSIKGYYLICSYYTPGNYAGIASENVLPPITAGA